MTKKVQSFPTTSWQFHLVFWVIYWIFSCIQDAPFHPRFRTTYNLHIVLGSIGIVYFNYNFWLPKYLIERKKYWFYSLGIVGFIFLNATLINFGVWLYTGRDYYVSLQGVMMMSLDTAVMVAFTTMFKFMQQWNERNNYAKELERKNLETELEMLKSQINPHFIFNALNMIYFLMEQKDEKAKEVLLKFSDILSHQLYDYNKDYVDLNKEIEYLENYIELQKMRHDDDILNLKYHLPRTQKHFKIAPMLLIPFIENAFKHGSNSKGFKVEIKMNLDEDILHFQTQNTVNPNKKMNGNVGGIGLKNVKRRLELMYPNHYELDIQNDGKIFRTILEIKLN
ncbi:MAG: sensor histidine kinase [Bacteroidetes bacterium]|jgi:sensor histidine kinase YesM|nr:sensor histidine kinase [Bacteroidota bacterium]MDF1864019.1 sensor histidine kinase [Saprospiraceae bacterium]